MKVAELSDGETFQPRRPTLQKDFLANDSRTVGLEQSGFDPESRSARGCRELDKVSSRRGAKRQSGSGLYSSDPSFQHNASLGYVRKAFRN